MNNNSIRYVALLRGVNVGGHGTMKMADLARSFESLGFRNVKTVLASGNVLFDAAEADVLVLTARIEKKLKSSFGQTTGVMLRTIDDLTKMIDSGPFPPMKTGSGVKLYVSFLGRSVRPNQKAPLEFPNEGTRIEMTTSREVFSVCTPLADGRVSNPMSVIAREFGDDVTTRNWNTIIRLVENK